LSLFTADRHPNDRAIRTLASPKPLSVAGRQPAPPLEGIDVDAQTDLWADCGLAFIRANLAEQGRGQRFRSGSPQARTAPSLAAANPIGQESPDHAWAIVAHDFISDETAPPTNGGRLSEVFLAHWRVIWAWAANAGRSKPERFHAPLAQRGLPNSMGFEGVWLITTVCYQL